MLDSLDTEIELLSASLLPTETLELNDSSACTAIRDLMITNHDSRLSIHIHVGDQYPARDAVTAEVKGNNIGRDKALEWSLRVEEAFRDWDQENEYPLYELLTSNMLAWIAPESYSQLEDTKSSTEIPRQVVPAIPHHVLVTSHHLLSPTKRKNFLALASRLSLTGYSKVGHPGIYYAIGDKEDLEEWLREVKSWNWLALRVRVGIEPTPEEQLSRNHEDGARGGKGRGDWVELEKIGEALEWMRKRDKDKMLLDIGIGR